MGWNSWNAFRCYGVTEEKIIEHADLLVATGLRDAGYRQLVLDDCWQSARRTDDDGFLVSNRKRFPSGIKYLADEVRARGLDFGMYLAPGRRTCAQIWDDYGFLGDYPREKRLGDLGSFGREEQDLRQLLSWGITFLKYDWCIAEWKTSRWPFRRLRAPETFRKMADLIAEADQEIIYSISEYGDHKPWLWAPKFANSWRTTQDIQPQWKSVLKIARFTSSLAKYSRPGHVNDPDMLQVGNIQHPYAGNINFSHLAMWAMLAAPLMAGNDLRRLDDSPGALAALLDQDLIELDQDPLVRSGRIVKQVGTIDLWQRQTVNGTAYLVVNTDDRRAHSVRLDQLISGKALVQARKLKLGADVIDLGHERNRFKRSLGPAQSLLILP